MQDTPESEGVGPTTQHKNCIKPTAAVVIKAAADQKGGEASAQPDSDPNQTISASSSADEVSPTEDMPTRCDGNPSPMKDIGYNEEIPADATPTPTSKKPQLAQECPAPVYMAKTSKCTATIHKRYAQAAQHSPEKTTGDWYINQQRWMHSERKGSSPQPQENPSIYLCPSPTKNHRI